MFVHQVLTRQGPDPVEIGFPIRIHISRFAKSLPIGPP